MIDGFLSSEIGLHTLRQRMSIIPQVDPHTFKTALTLSSFVLALKTAYSNHFGRFELNYSKIEIKYHYVLKH